MDRELAELVDGVRRDEAVAERRRARWLADEAAADLTLAGVAAALAEHGEPVVVVTQDGEQRSGPVLGVGPDVLVLGGAVERVVPLAAVALVHGEPTVRARTDAPSVRATTVPSGSLAEALGALVAERWQVTVRATGAGPVRGRAWASGPDVLVVRGDDGRLVHVAVAAICEVVLR